MVIFIIEMKDKWWFKKTPRAHFENVFLRATQLVSPQRMARTALKQRYPPILILRWKRRLHFPLGKITLARQILNLIIAYSGCWSHNIDPRLCQCTAPHSISLQALSQGSLRPCEYMWDVTISSSELALFRKLQSLPVASTSVSSCIWQSTLMPSVPIFATPE